jgi:hypothetical protein
MEKDKDDLETIDSCFNTENEHWNKFAFKVHCKAIEEGLFSDPIIPLLWIDKAIERFVKGYNTPDATVQEFIQELRQLILAPLKIHLFLHGLNTIYKILSLTRIFHHARNF